MNVQAALRQTMTDVPGGLVGAPDGETVWQQAMWSHLLTRLDQMYLKRIEALIAIKQGAGVSTPNPLDEQDDGFGGGLAYIDTLADPYHLAAVNAARTSSPILPTVGPSLRVGGRLSSFREDDR